MKRKEKDTEVRKVKDLHEINISGREEIKYEIIRNIASGVAEPVTE